VITRWKSLLAIGCLFCLVGHAHAGKLFDDYLNYVRPGPGTGPGNTQAVASNRNLIAQSFTVSQNTGEIYRIGIRPIYKTWDPGERVVMALFTMQGNHKLGQYVIDETTSHIQSIYDLERRRETDDRVLWFQFRALTNGHNKFYFKIGVQGGDGQVAFKAFKGDHYPDGFAQQTPPNIGDLSFEVHIKPVPDREANLRKFFTERVNIDLPELSEVKQAVEKENWQQAIHLLAKHFHDDRREIWDVWEGEMNVHIIPDFDTSLADLVMKGYLQHRETKKPVAWRPESYWVPEYDTERKPRKHAVDPALYWWHIGRTLGGAYTCTGKEEYARRAIDLRMQFILDNPSPKRSGLPMYFELWSDRHAAARAPGHGVLVYARFYNYDGFTDDEQLVFMSFVEDNANWTYQAKSGGNWGAEASRACYEFGKNFPEWSMSREYVNWGTARRLKGMLKNHIDGEVTLDENVFQKLMKRVEAMYDFMAYTTQPHGYVVMCGDSWYENFKDLAEVGEMVNRPDFVWIGTKGEKGRPPERAGKVYPESGYFIMRSEPQPSEDYQDARHLFVHNGMWFASHGHFDLLYLSLYAYGRPLIIDPGQYDYEPPAGFDRYWQSSIHSMLVPEGKDAKREPGPNKWISNQAIDWLDGKHFGYANLDKVNHVRRRILFVKPDYFIVDDSADTERNTDWTQVWNLTDPNPEIDSDTKTIRTTFSEGGNVVIMNRDPEGIRPEPAKGMTASDDFPETCICRLTRKTSDPRFKTLVYPYKGQQHPKITWSESAPGSRYDQRDGLSYTLLIETPKGKDWLALGKTDRKMRYRDSESQVAADAALVRMDQTGQIKQFAWTFGQHLTYQGKTLAQADRVVHSLAVQYEGAKMIVEAKEPEHSLAISAGGATTIELNGMQISNPVIRDGMYHPFADQPVCVVADNIDAFKRITKTNEWMKIADPQAYGGTYEHHETDPGRGESGVYSFRVHDAGNYRVETYLGNLTITPSNKTEYEIRANGQPAQTGGAVLKVDKGRRNTTVTVDHQAKCGWVSLGEYKIPRGLFRIKAKNVTETDGIYFIGDAMRLVKLP